MVVGLGDGELLLWGEWLYLDCVVILLCRRKCNILWLLLGVVISRLYY